MKKQRLENSTSELTQAILGTIRSVPYGRVATYGQIAELAGAKGAARAVGRVMRNLPADTQIPWHRILNASGTISIPQPSGALQRERLESEGVVFLKGKVSLQDYQWRP